MIGKMSDKIGKMYDKIFTTVYYKFLCIEKIT